MSPHRQLPAQPDAKQHRHDDFATRHPYVFVASLELLLIAVFMSAGAINGLLAEPLLALIAIVIITRKHWWRRIGFVFPVPKETARALWLSAPAFLGVLWWFVVAPLVGYGTIRLPASAATLALYVGVCLLVGFVEEVYFRGLMLQALKPRGLWLAAIVTSILFGATHALNVLGAASPLYTALQVGYAFALGLLFAALVLVTRLIWPVILAHFLTNLGAYLNSAAGGPISTTVTATDYAMTASVVVVFTAYAVYLLMSKRNSERFA